MKILLVNLLVWMAACGNPQAPVHCRCADLAQTDKFVAAIALCADSEDTSACAANSCVAHCMIVD